MKSNLTLVLAILTLGTFAVSESAHAQMNYQGRLTDPAGLALTAASADLTFNIYNVAVNGSPLWGPFTFTGVDLINGRFNVVLPSSDGSGLNLAQALEGTAYVHITVTPTGGSTNTGLPRQQIYAAPKALNAELATHAGTASNFVSGVLYTRDVTGGNLVTEDGVTQGNERVGIGTENPVTKLHIVGGDTDATPSSHHGSIVLGELDGLNMVLSQRKIMARNNGVGETIFINSQGGDVWLGTDNSDVVMRGKVGLGTSSPTAGLEIINTTQSADAGGMLSIGQATGQHMAFDRNDIQQYAGDGITPGKLHLNDWGGDVNIGNSSTTTSFDGKVGIGVTTPTRGKVEIAGFSGDNDLAQGFGVLNSNAVSTNGIANDDIVSSLYCTNRIIAFEFIAPSDERIKNIEGRSDAARDLKALLGIEVTDYQHIDTVTKGDKRYKKVIAQQVETVFPQAVNQMTDCVPDIYKKAPVEDGWVKLKTDLKKGERVRLIGSENEDNVHEVLEVKEDQFRTDFAGKEQAFVYGREVNDFRTVDYEAIAMLNVSATQELHRQLKSAQTELAAKTNEISTLEQRLADLEAANKARDEKFAKLERLLDSPSKIVPVSID